VVATRERWYSAQGDDPGFGTSILPFPIFTPSPFSCLCARWIALAARDVWQYRFAAFLPVCPFGNFMVRSSITHAALFAAICGGCQFAAPAQNAEGVKMFQQAYYQGALQRFQQAIASDPHNSDGYYNLAATYHQMARQHAQPVDWQQAEAYYGQCLQRNPSHADCHRGLAVLLTERGRQQESFRLLEAWAARNPGSASPRIELARLYDEAGNPQMAKERLVEAVQIEPNNARALAALGNIREQLGDATQALANYERSLNVNQFQPQLSARVASLRSAMTPPVSTPPGGTRVVTTPNGRLR
jgi:tetratricopeptide (TPR) repeat protein